MRPLQTNLVIFLKTLPKLLPEHEGEYALVCNGDLSIFGTADEATKAAMARCGDVTKFLVTKIEAPEASAYRIYK
jgi:hypothetical protein